MTMSKTLSIITASVAAFLIVFLSVAHACSGLVSMNRVMQQSPMNMGARDGSPCDKETDDICKAVRDSMLSVKPSAAGIDNVGEPFSTAPISFATPNLPSLSPVAFVSGISFHPVFKLPLSLSYLVLRI
jgi:hypothetical protein